MHEKILYLCDKRFSVQGHGILFTRTKSWPWRSRVPTWATPSPPNQIG